MVVHCIIGAKARERVKTQSLIISLSLHTDFSVVASTDDLSDAKIDYAVVSKEVYNYVVNKKAKMLEHLAEDLSQFLFAFSEAVIGLDLTLQKPSAIPLADFATVAIRRTRGDYPWIQPARDKVSELKKKEDVYIALGSNLGMRERNISEAILRISKFAIVGDVSHLYDTNPRYVTDQPRFLNCVVKVTTELEPQELLESLKEIEESMGRQKTKRNGPRVIDLDIVLYGRRRVLTSSLVVPHPQMQERDFVMGPLLDIAPPHLQHPTLAKTLKDLWLDLGKCEGIVPVWSAPCLGEEGWIDLVVDVMRLGKFCWFF
eukprot:TRINITY_DN4953_c0_g2_i3.p1 TRINITY_DN4953_c0_g2~~TRINITY_DN4953_c0_g2_i3.p1  ORF type:complete len:370 (-),score=80.69 TRINITY_DN4953_c0_g2_i3:1089-2036(-)